MTKVVNIDKIKYRFPKARYLGSISIECQIFGNSGLSRIDISEEF